jgi:hypothetical protein
MSYSFSARAASKAAVIEVVRAKLAEVVAQQPVHAADQAQAQAASEVFINMLVDDDTRDVFISVNGSVWQTPEGLQSTGFGINASLQARI